MNPIGCKASFSARFWVGLAFLAFGALPAQAQFVPRGGGYYYPDMSVMGLATSAYSTAQGQNAYMQDRQLQATSSMVKSQAWQNVNRSMQSQAASRPAMVSDSGQVARDWMFQHEAPSRPARRPMTLPATELAAVTPVPEPSMPAAPREIMRWPTLLKEQRFDGDRTDVEAPFRRASADGKPLTVEDYQGIVKTVENMKATVKDMESQIVDDEYAAVQKYLDDLIADAQKRIQAREAAGKSE
ncbi:MAG: hypothetical protein ABSE63_15850 [Thermoguttaceae bacterium]|jgi:hypothetical protein